MAITVTHFYLRRKLKAPTRNASASSHLLFATATTTKQSLPRSNSVISSSQLLLVQKAITTKLPTAKPLELLNQRQE
jgi:hypothetical protein